MLRIELISCYNRQTEHALIVHTISPTLEVKADILKMRHLRHFKTNATATLSKPSPGSKHGAELQTLGTISAESCTAELCNRAPNLKKLGIRGRLALLFQTQIGFLDSLGNMEHLRKLKLINDVHPKPPSEGRLHRLPLYDQFPSGLTSLTLCSTYLSWDHMYTVGLLEKLTVLKLKDNAFTGDTWEVQSGGFQYLEYLRIELTELAFWRASPLSYPKLTSIVLKNCEKLCEIPIEFVDIPTLRMLELYCCPSAAESATKISEAKQKTPAGGPEFKFSIIPPME